VLPKHPDLDQLKRQAKELLDAVRAGEPDAVQKPPRDILALTYRNSPFTMLNLCSPGRTGSIAGQAQSLRERGHDQPPEMESDLGVMSGIRSQPPRPATRARFNA